MPTLNIKTDLDLENIYASGLLPQRNQKGLFYQESSSRSNLSFFSLSSENRRIIRKTENFSYDLIDLDKFEYNLALQKTIHSWLKSLAWEFPISSVKTVFTNHIFNKLYIWKNEKSEIVAYSICLFTDNISHIAYVFYDPKYSHSDLPIRLVLQFVIDSAQKSLKYAYLGRFAPDKGYYKRNMPGFEYYLNESWSPYQNKTS